MTDASIHQTLIQAARDLSDAVDQLSFGDPVTHVYNPLNYARSAHEAYLSMVGNDVSVVFLGMNPGPWGMAQTGVPFGEIAAVKDWMKIQADIGKPANEHSKRPVDGLDCPRSEVSGRRLWGLFSERYKTPKQFFRRHFIANYCPLVFMEQSARNRTPDKLPATEREPLDAVCDQHLQTVLQTIQPKFAIGVGAYAEKQLQKAIEATGSSAKLSRVLHPSPASPAANRGWAEQATKQLIEAGVWRK